MTDKATGRYYTRTRNEVDPAFDWMKGMVTSVPAETITNTGSGKNML